ncbi:MAG: tRNA (adenosine(37)-N6)-dimethylallyltransferase MiaA [Candidatus Omnitrophota bacterium]|nr:tRNA (adenosine(37)-N6)-dimethylallyltransferase MiaA [Candidatus Omnitrophota bacterium]MDZ4242146.1 tRNA (adenosine(37)-N6)-dimethylallyltransferase MiaA [Candidatus Omnitrophota bacterium]
MPRQKILFVVGPTAVGKTDVAFALARRLGSEVISCDAMQVYREVSIATNKPSPKVLKTVPHHLIGHVPVEQKFDVVSFRAAAVREISRLLADGKVPVVAGGSGMYMQVLLDGIFEDVGKAPGVRPHLEARADAEGVDALHRALAGVDPAAAQKIHPGDRRRIIRALEVYASTKRPISELQKSRRGLWEDHDVSVFALNRDRRVLYEAINARVDKMFEEGLLDEVRRLRAKPLSPTAEAIIGIQEVWGYLDGQYDLDRAKYLMKINTRHLAKRQLTWFRKDKRLQWIDVDKFPGVEKVVEYILSQTGIFDILKEKGSRH